MIDEHINSKLAVFQGRHIRRILHNSEWWFSVIDIIEVLTDSSIPKRYWSDLKRKLSKEGYNLSCTKKSYNQRAFRCIESSGQYKRDQALKPLQEEAC